MNLRNIYICLFMIVGCISYGQQISLNLGVNTYSNRYIAKDEGFITVYSDENINKPRINFIAGLKFEIIKQLSIEYTYQKSSKSLRYFGHWNGANKFHTKSEIFDNVLYWNITRKFSLLTGVRYVQFYNSHFRNPDDTYNSNANNGHFFSGIIGLNYSISNFSAGIKYSRSRPVNQIYNPIWRLNQLDVYIKYDLKFILEKDNKVICPNF